MDKHKKDIMESQIKEIKDTSIDIRIRKDILNKLQLNIIEYIQEDMNFDLDGDLKITLDSKLYQSNLSLRLWYVYKNKTKKGIYFIEDLDSTLLYIQYFIDSVSDIEVEKVGKIKTKSKNTPKGIKLDI